jgi:hypothetical protein
MLIYACPPPSDERRAKAFGQDATLGQCHQRKPTKGDGQSYERPPQTLARTDLHSL